MGLVLQLVWFATGLSNQHWSLCALGSLTLGMCMLNGLVTAFVDVCIMHLVFVHVECHPESSVVVLNGSNSIVHVRIIYGPINSQPPLLHFLFSM
jgi:hypothetical protein